MVHKVAPSAAHITDATAASRMRRMRRNATVAGICWVARLDDGHVTLYPVAAVKRAAFVPFAATVSDVAAYPVRVSMSSPRLIAAVGAKAAPPDKATLAAMRHLADARPMVMARFVRDTLVLRNDGPLCQGGRAKDRALRRRFVIALAASASGLVPRLRRFNGVYERRNDLMQAPSDGKPPRAARKPKPKARSALFLHSAYYNFGYLAAALRARGWDAVSASTADPEGYSAMYTHGHDVVLHDPDPRRARAQISDFVGANLDRFGIVHFYGVGASGIFFENWDNTPSHDRMPWDLLEWKRRGALIGYSTTGCLDMVSQSAFRLWSRGMCDHCPNQNKPDTCSDGKNLAWGAKIAALADVISIEADVRLDFRRAPNVFHEPLTFALNPEVWRPDLPIPEEFRQARAPGEVLVYHGVGNFDARQREGRNVKGTQAVQAAIKALQVEGVPIRLMFTREVPNLQNRYYEAQADIVVDQLNYGRYGATAREGMMLGKPVVGAVDAAEPHGPPTHCMLETPIVHADEQTITAVLRALATDPVRRMRLGAESRAHALKWWSADVLAARFERVYDHIRATGRVPSFEEVN